MCACTNTHTHIHTQSRVEEINKSRLNYAQLLKLSNREFKIFMTNVVKAIVEKVNNMYEQMENYSRETEAIKNQMDILENFLKI